MYIFMEYYLNLNIFHRQFYTKNTYIQNRTILKIAQLMADFFFRSAFLLFKANIPSTLFNLFKFSRPKVYIL